MINPEELIALPLSEAISKLEGVDIKLVSTDANFALKKSIDKSEYSSARVLRATAENNTVTLLYDTFKEFKLAEGNNISE